MSKLKRFSSLKTEEYEIIEPMELMLKDFEVPDGLEEKIVAAMAKRRAEIARKEAERNAFRKKAARRVAAVVAIIVLAIAIPSVRGTVVSAGKLIKGIIEEFFHMDTIVLNTTESSFNETSNLIFSVENDSDDSIYVYDSVTDEYVTPHDDIYERKMNIGNFNQTIDMETFSIEFGDLTIYEDSIFSMILSDDNALFVDENGFVKGEYLTHVFSKISYNGNIDGFENYTPNFTVNANQELKD